MSGQPKTVLVRGTGTDLGDPVVAGLLARGATVAIHDPDHPERAAALCTLMAERGLPGTLLDLTPLSVSDDPFAALAAAGHRLDAVIHLHLPDASTDAPALRGYPEKLRAMQIAAIDHMKATESPGIVIHQFLMGTLFSGHPLAEALVEARNGLTGLTRLGCLSGGRAGIRVASLLVGLLELPSLRALATERVNAAKTPLGRWITPAEVAGTLAFLSLDSGYMSGQMLVLDGGMTGGINGV